MTSVRALDYCILEQNPTLGPSYFTRVDDVEEQGHLSRLRRVNFIVGPNNGGKSHLLRTLSRTLVTLEGFGSADRALDKLFTSPEYVAFGTGMEGHLPDLVRLRSIRGAMDGGSSHLQFLIAADQLMGVMLKISVWDTSRFGDMLRQLKEWRSPCSLAIVYVPAARSVREWQATGALLTELPGFTESKGGVKSKGDRSSIWPVLLAGDKLRQEVLDHRIGERSKRLLIDEFERFVDEQLFDKMGFELIPRQDPKALFFRVGGEAERPFYQLGDGLQQCILMLWPLFRDTANDLVLAIDEPELNLHPGMQRKLLRCLFEAPCERPPTIVLATHSNHFLDAALDYSSEDFSIFRVSKRRPKDGDPAAYAPEFVIERTDPDDTRVLQDLGVRPSSVLLANGAIWVEGISDRIYVRHWLSLWAEAAKGRRFAEELDFTFVEYGGSNRDHFAFGDESFDHSGTPIQVQRVTRHAFLLADGDEAVGAKKAKLEQLRAGLRDERLHVTKGREVENLISAPVLGRWLRKEGGEKNCPDPVAGTYETQYLGSFLSSFFLEKTGKQLGGRKSNSGTVGQKTDFAKAITGLTKQWADLSPEAQELTGKLAAFIYEANGWGATPAVRADDQTTAGNAG